MKEKIIKIKEKTINFLIEKEKNKKKNIKEKIKDHNIFFEVLNEKIFIEKFIEIYNFIEKEESIKENNNKIIEFLEIFFEKNKEIVIFFYSFLIFKTFICSNLIEKEEIDKWKNSDVILNELKKTLTNFIIYYDIKIKNTLKEDFITCHFFYVISYLVYKKILEEKVVRVRIEDLEDEEIFENMEKTIKFWSMGSSLYFFNSYEFLNISKVKFEIKKFNKSYYIISTHFNKTKILYRKNFRSNESFELKNKEYLKRIIECGVYVDKEGIVNAIKTIESEENIKFEKIEEEIKDLYNIIDKDEIDKKIKKEIQSKISKKLQYLYLKMMYNNTKDENEKIYFPFFFDFRGRLYYDSPISITNFKIARIIYFYGYIKYEEIVQEKIEYLKLEKKEIECIEESLDIMGIKKNQKNIDLCLWILISIGKIFINKSEEKIELIEFLKNAKKHLKEEITKEKLELFDKLELNHYTKILEDVRKEGIMKRKIIIKDATASVIQNLMRVLNPKFEESLRIANISGKKTWYDPYSYILNKFKEKNEIKEEYKDYFIRKTIKKVIMTIPYTARENTCFNYFISEIKKKKKDIKADEEIKKEFKKFYIFVKNEVEENYLYEKSSNKLLEEFKNEKKKEKIEYIVIDNQKEKSKTNLMYYKLRTKYFEIKFEVEGQLIRKTKKWKKVDERMIPDMRKFNSSFKANFIHFRDAEYLREVLDEFEENMKTVHDAFLVDFIKTPKLIKICNKIIKTNKIDNKEFSIFILL